MSKKTSKLVVHMIGNAHLDPAWLWTWQSGVDEALATCRTACDLLDQYPDLHVTRGEAWVHYQVQKHDPATFKRIVAHVKAGRWHVVNGWWVQPDCNLPSPEAFMKQAEIGGRYFRDELGIKVNVGYNVDSFGHCAMLPTFLRQSGKEFYTFMRPMANEMKMPSNLFRWKSPAGDEVLAFRLAVYNAASVFDMKRNIETEIAAAPAGVGHTMCFYGIGDHGGGPTRDQVEWIAEHRKYSENVELRFSHPEAFFRAVKSQKASLPVITGELNPHAIGCYTVVRDIKRECRRAEMMLLQAENAAKANGVFKDKAIQFRFEEAWRTVLFNQFHDIMGGSSIKTVCTQAVEELGAAKAFARELLVEFTRKANVAMAPCPRQQIVVDNPSASEWAGLVEFNPWFQTDGSPTHFSLQNGQGEPVRFQSILPTYPGPGRNNVLFPVTIPAGGRQTVEIRRLVAAPPAGESELRIDNQTMTNSKVSLTGNATGIANLSLKGKNLLGADGIKVCVIEDNSDTWSHDLMVYDGPVVETLTAEQPWTALERGPIRAALHNTLLGKSGKLSWIIQLAEGAKSIRMRLSLNWWGRNKIVKLIIPPGFKPTIRRDGTPGAIIERPLDKREYPVTDTLTLSGKGASLTTVSPDIYSADVQPDGTMRLTLVRCPVYSHHDPVKVEASTPYFVTDQGVHDYEIELLVDESFQEKAALEAARNLNFPVWVSESTKGMPSGWRYDNPPRQIPAGMPPVTPAEALVAHDLAKLMTDSAKIVPAGDLCPRWSGEHLLVSKGSSLKLPLPIAVDGKYSISIARLAGKGFGDAMLVLNGKEVTTLAGGSGKPSPKLHVIEDVHIAGNGSAELELKTAGRDRLALAFVHTVAKYKDIPANAWMVAGPFIFCDEHSRDRSDVTEKSMKSDYPPDKSRDFGGTYPLVDGTSAKWMQSTSDGDFLDFHALTGRKLGSIHYAVTQIWSESPRKVRLAFGLDFTGKIWLNRAIVTPLIHGSGAPFKRQLSLDVELKQGWNELMVKVASGTAGNGLWMSISDVGDLKFAAQVRE